MPLHVCRAPSQGKHNHIYCCKLTLPLTLISISQPNRLERMCQAGALGLNPKVRLQHLCNQSLLCVLLNMVLLFYNIYPPNQPLLAKNKAQKHAFCPFSVLTHLIFTSILSKKSAFCTILPFYLLANSRKFIVPKTAFRR